MSIFENVGELRYARLPKFYHDRWYANQVTRSLESARIFVNAAWSYVQPRSVLDVGCGRGAWLKAWRDNGAEVIVGYDGAWNNQANMIDPAISFKATDLNAPFADGRRFDLAMSVEVAEHLEENNAGVFVDSLTASADIVLFGAAFSHQGGNNHINEQPHTYWAQIFSERGFLPFDLFRPYLWNDERICYWYRQNTFLYAKKNSDDYNRLLAHDAKPMDNVGFMDAIHPFVL